MTAQKDKMIKYEVSPAIAAILVLVIVGIIAFLYLRFTQPQRPDMNHLSPELKGLVERGKAAVQAEEQKRRLQSAPSRP